MKLKLVYDCSFWFGEMGDSTEFFTTLGNFDLLWF